MTRYTNLGRKRTYVEAGFNYRDEDQLSTQTAGASTSSASGPRLECNPPEKQLEDSGDTITASSPKRKRKRSKKRNESGDANEERTTADGQAGETSDDPEKEIKAAVKSAKIQKANSRLKDKKKAKRAKGAFSDRRAVWPISIFLVFHLADAADRAAASEKRRLKRIAERHANTVCFVCRQNGHAAVMCPNNTKNDSEDTGAGAQVGICYRCLSRLYLLTCVSEHTLRVNQVWV